MRSAFIVLLLSTVVFIPQFVLAAAPVATVSLGAPITPKPASGAPFITFPLQLGWEGIEPAQSYRYELIGYQENGTPKEFLTAQSQSDPFSPDVVEFLEPQHPSSWYQDECKNLKNKDEDKDGKLDECTDGELRTFIKQQQKRLWHVKSCEDTEGTTCGPWSAVWDFTYLLEPAVLNTPAANANPSIPITLDWKDVSGAKSYDLITLPCPPWGVQDPDTDCYSLPISPEETVAPSEYADNECFFTRKSEYAWGVASCLDAQASFCTHPNDLTLQSFYTSASAPPLSTPDGPTLLEPYAKESIPPTAPVILENIPSVSKNTLLRWNGDMCAYFYRVNVFNEAGTRITQDDCLFSGSACTKEIGDETLLLEAVERLWDQPGDLDKTYSWSVTPCWSSMGPSFTPTPDCTNTTDSIQWYFHTTGKPPTLLTPVNNSSTKIPVALTWEPVGGAESYRYEILKDGVVVIDEFATEARVELAYETGVIDLNTQYSWRVKTCVDTEGKVCGQWSAAFQFTTFPLAGPDTPNPSNGGSTFLTSQVSWNNVLGANFYQYHLEYACRDEKETSERCLYKTQVDVCPADGSDPVTPSLVVEVEKIISSNSFELPYCVGKYKWAVRSCLDESCSVASPALLQDAPIWTLAALQPPPTGVGLVPCGKPTNEPATPYDETDSCQPKHILLLLQNLLDFILWKVSLFVLLILAVMTGATSYFSLGGPNALARIKTVFRSFFVGFLILMFAWMFVNIVLMLFGFQFEFFGRWWEISF
jgi:hypothetical protein